MTALVFLIIAADYDVVETFHFGAGDYGNTTFGPWGSNGPDNPTYILANGDTTGYGLHGDFQNVGPRVFINVSPAKRLDRAGIRLSLPKWCKSAPRQTSICQRMKAVPS